LPGTNLSIPPTADVRDSLRQAVSMAEAEIGRPVTRRELGLWAQHAAAAGLDEATVSVAEVVLRPGLGRTFNSLVQGEGQSTGGPGTLRPIRTPLTARGSYPVHYSAGGVNPGVGGVCLLRDLAVLLRPAEEITGQAHFEKELGHLGLITREIIEYRRSALLHSVLMHGPARWHGPGIASAAEKWITSAGVLALWIEASSLSPCDLQAEIDKVADLSRHIEAMENFCAHERVRDSDPDVRVVASHPGVRLESLEDLAAEANDVVGRHPKHWRHLFADARRVRGPQAGGVAADHREQLESFLDRPDVFHVMAATCPLPKFGAAVSAAQLVMGEVLRDERLIAAWLRRCPPHADYFRNALTVAMGLLGFVPDVSDAWPDESNASHLEAFLVAVVVGVADPDARLRIAREVERRARGSAAALVRRVMPRLEMGDRLSVID
jgi:hypothetical protein